MEIETKYEAKCGACKKHIKQGVKVWWYKELKTVVHLRCKDKKVKPKKKFTREQSNGRVKFWS